jgi:hypothetical protein
MQARRTNRSGPSSHGIADRACDVRLAADFRERLLHPVAEARDQGTFAQPIEACVGIGLQCTLEGCEVLMRMLARAVRSISKPHARGCRLPSGSLIPDIPPQASCLGAPFAWLQYQNKRIVGMQLRCAHHLLAQRFVQWLQKLAYLAHPIRESGALQIQPFPRVDL